MGHSRHGLTNYEVAEMLDELPDSDFLEVFLSLGLLNGIIIEDKDSLRQFIKWLYCSMLEIIYNEQAYEKEVIV